MSKSHPPHSPPLRRTSRWYLIATIVLMGGPALALGLPQSIRIPIAREHAPSEPPDAALFSHWAHDSFACSSCHPSIFPQRKVGFTHDDMAAGRFCGSCHDGRLAFSPKGKGVECETCHVATKKRPEINEDELWK